MKNKSDAIKKTGKCNHHFFCLGERPLPSPIDFFKSFGKSNYLPDNFEGTTQNLKQSFQIPAVTEPRRYAKFVCEYCGLVKMVKLIEEEQDDEEGKKEKGLHS